MNKLITTVSVNQPLALPGPAKYEYTHSLFQWYSLSQKRKYPMNPQNMVTHEEDLNYRWEGQGGNAQFSLSIMSEDRGD